MSQGEYFPIKVVRTHAFEKPLQYVAHIADVANNKNKSITLFIPLERRSLKNVGFHPTGS